MDKVELVEEKVDKLTTEVAAINNQLSLLLRHFSIKPKCALSPNPELEPEPEPEPEPPPPPPAATVGSPPPPDTDSPLLRNLESR
eukprot:COSAG01_NODE_1608_length_9744_cov_3.534266_4_plen_85_part_00